MINSAPDLAYISYLVSYNSCSINQDSMLRIALNLQIN